MSLLFCMIEVRRGCSVRRRTSQLEIHQGVYVIIAVCVSAIFD